MAKLETILIYPIKSLDAVSVNQAKILPGGALEHDREFCIVDESGTWVNGKRTAKIHQIRSQFDLKTRLVTLSVQNDRPVSFHLDHGRSGIEGWLSDYFGFRVFLKQDLTTGFPDDPVSPGPTLISIATLEKAASWFEGMSAESMRSRLRTNLELSEVPAFWEEQLYSADGSSIKFQIGDVQIQGINPCARCVVPTRDAVSGDRYPQFQKTFITQREKELPDWAAKERFDHYYRMAVNTRIASSESGKVLKVGNVLTWSGTS
ncbi:MOSC N-terminal beta barrel domain-containing protein [Pseudanabaenaceae cyanobacterium LEGE 13415]|nr:MOSC N-terminal beta barrel domain-containing protein [Pseudanabaenaceae cyanobacterium LEGE 13415]